MEISEFNKRLDESIKWHAELTGMLRMEKAVLKWLVENKASLSPVVYTQISRVMDGVRDAHRLVEPKIAEGTCSSAK